MALTLPADAAKPVASVIGNAACSQAGTLTNAVNDATDRASALKKFGFEVILGLDLDRRNFGEKFRAFSYALEDADRAVLFSAGDEGMTYFVACTCHKTGSSSKPGSR